MSVITASTLQFSTPAPTQRPPSLSGASLVIGTVCVLRAEKGLVTLLEAFLRGEEFPPGLRLVIVGSGPELGGLERLSSDLGLAGDCLFYPSTNDVPYWLRTIDVFVLPSLSEGSLQFDYGSHGLRLLHYRVARGRQPRINRGRGDRDAVRGRFRPGPCGETPGSHRESGTAPQFIATGTGPGLAAVFQPDLGSPDGGNLPAGFLS